MIHRSTLHDAINEKEKKKKPRFLVEILTALAEAKGQPEKEIAAIKQENKVKDEVPRCSEENMDGQNNVEVPEVDSKGDESEEEESEREKESDAEKINGIVRVLEKLEQVHWQHRNELVEMNKDLEDPGLKKVSKMEGKIQQVKESFGTREKKESLHPRPAQSGGEDCSSRRRHQGRRRGNKAAVGGRCQPQRGRL